MAVLRNVAQLKRQDFRFWKAKLPETNRLTKIEEMSAALNYIEHLAASTSADISGWDILAIFSTDEYEIETDRNKINELFLSTINEIRAAARPNVDQTTLKQEILESCKELGEVQLERRKDRLRTELEEQRETIQSRQERLRDAISVAYETKQKIECFNGQSNLADEIEKISENQFWQFEKLASSDDSPVLYLQTTTECTVRHRENSLNFGKFRAKISLGDPYIWVLPLSNNLHYNFEYYHPHISTSGQVCWGNASSTVTENLVDGKLSNVVQLLQSLLMHYNSESPYASYETFVNSGRRLQNYNRFYVVEEDQRQARRRGEDVSVYPAVPIVVDENGVRTSGSMSAVAVDENGETSDLQDVEQDNDQRVFDEDA